MKTIDNDIKAGEFKQVYLLYGDEQYLIRQYRDKLKKAMVAEDDTMNFSAFEGADINQKEIIDLLNQLRLVQGKHLSILFICHDLSLVQQFCDRVLVMYQGEIVEQGKPDDVIQKPEHAYTRRLIDSVLEFE